MQDLQEGQDSPDHLYLQLYEAGNFFCHYLMIYWFKRPSIERTPKFLLPVLRTLAVVHHS